MRETLLGHDADDWRLSDDEWRQLGHLLSAPHQPPSPKGGRPRLDNDRLASQACLFRHYHELAPVYHCFGWNNIPAELGVSPATANHRFRAWSAYGVWDRFWDALIRLRRGGDAQPRENRPQRPLDSFPASDVVAELERAYAFFNDYFFAGSLGVVAITAERFVGNQRRQDSDFCPRHWRLGDLAVGHIALSSELRQWAKELVTAPRLLAPTRSDLNYLKRYLDETADECNQRIGDRPRARGTAGNG